MCKLVPVLRVIGFIFLVLAILVCLVGFIAPFWIRIPIGDSLVVITSEEAPLTGSVLGAVETGDAAAVPEVVASDRSGGSQQVDQIVESTERQQGQWPSTTMSAQLTSSSMETSAAQNIVNSISAFITDGTYFGLWGMCHSNLTCTWFCEKDFKMERAYPEWHKVVQGLYGIGLVVLLVALCTASFHVCCCHCCRESFAIATVVGSFIATGLILITLSLLVYAGFAVITQTIEITGSRVFEWAFFVPMGGIGLALISAILFLVDGRHRSNDMDGDGEETAKMV